MIVIKQGDTRTGIGATLITSGGNPAPLLGADVEIVLKSRDTCIRRQVDMILPDQGKVFFKFQPGETDIPSRFKGEFKVTFPDGAVETFPNQGCFVVLITRSVDEEGC